MFKIENITSDIKLHDQKIADRFIVSEGIVKTRGIILKKPFKLQITAVSKAGGTKRKRVRSVEYNGTLAEAVKDALRLRDDWKEELKKEAPKKSDMPVTEMLTLDQAFELYVTAQKSKYKRRGAEYDEYRYRKVYEKWIKAALGKILLDNIDAEDIEAVVNGMTVKRAVYPKEIEGYFSNGKPRYKTEIRPAAERTKRTIYQLINPIYSYVNNSNKIKLSVASPARMIDLPPLENEKEVTVTIDSFNELYHYDIPRYRDFFVWLMHGRRFGEVASLTYEDIDFDSGTYTIRKENNKARVAMTYKLTKWQFDTLDSKGKGLCFPSMNSDSRKMNSSTLQAHFKLGCTLHDLRHVLGTALINSGVSIEVIGRILGHKPTKNVITNRYAKVSAEAAQDALEGVLNDVLR